MCRVDIKTAEKNYNWRVSANCPLNGKCQIEGVVYGAIEEPTKVQEKVYIGSTEGTFKKIFF